MTATPAPGQFAHLLPADSYAAWRIMGDGTSTPLDITATTLDEAIQQAGQRCQHKDWYTVLQCTPTRRIEHVCYVKQGKPAWVRKPGFAHTVQIKPLEGELRFSRAVRRIEPVETFRAIPGADVVGIDRSVVEAR